MSERDDDDDDDLITGLIGPHGPGVTVHGRAWTCTYYVGAGGAWAVGCRPSALTRTELQEQLRLCNRLGHAAIETDDGTLRCRRCGARVPLEAD